MSIADRLPNRSLHVLADLTLTVEGEQVAIRGEGDRIVIDLPSLQAGRKLAQAGPFSQTQRAEGVARLHEILTSQNLTAEVRLYGDVLARVGAEARPGAISRLLNLGAVEVRPARPVVSAARRRPLVSLGLGALVAAILGFFLFRSGSSPNEDAASSSSDED
jgi:hypothetical protein